MNKLFGGLLELLSVDDGIVSTKFPHCITVYCTFLFLFENKNIIYQVLASIRGEGEAGANSGGPAICKGYWNPTILCFCLSR